MLPLESPELGVTALLSRISQSLGLVLDEIQQHVQLELLQDPLDSSPRDLSRLILVLKGQNG